MTRWHASGLHFCISLAVMAGVLGLMLGLWYPGGYFQAMGGGKLFFILAGVDVCLGPLLTLVVFKSGKQGLKFDLAVIASAQLLALSYGVWVMSQARPVYTVFAVNSFLIAGANDLQPAQLAQASRPEWRTLPWTGPLVAAADLPSDPAQRQELVKAAIVGIDLHQFPAYYVPYAERTEKVLQAAKPLAALRSITASNAAVVDDFLKQQGGQETAYVFVPVRTFWEQMAVVLDARSAAIIAIIPAKPW